MHSKSVELEEPLLYWDYIWIWEGRCDTVEGQEATQPLVSLIQGKFYIDTCVDEIHFKLKMDKETFRNLSF